MSSRAFSTTAKKFLKLVGKVSLEDVVQTNGKDGFQWAQKVQSVAGVVESQYTDVVSYEIQGAKAHKSHKDPTETQNVITLAFFTIKGSRVASVHAREDGSYSIKPVRRRR